MYRIPIVAALLAAFAPAQAAEPSKVFIYADLWHPWTVGFKHHPVMRGFWKYLDIDNVKLAAAGGK